MKTKICSIFGLVAFVIAPLFARAAIADLEAIQPDGFSRGVVLTVAGYDASRSTLTDFPVLVRISETGITGFDYDDMMFPSNGDDLCFVAEDGTPLAFDIDTWNPAGESLVWVKLPSMQHGTEFAMFYRSSKSGKSVCGDNAFSNYVGVWHMGDAGNGAVPVADAGPSNLVTTAGANSRANSDGMVGGARMVVDLRTKNADAIKVTKTGDSTAALATLGTNFTYSAWYRPYGKISNDNNSTVLSTAAGIGYDVLVARKNTKATASWGVQVMDKPNGLRVYTSQTAEPKATDEILDFKQGQWGRFDIVYDSTVVANKTHVSIYWNGELVYGPTELNLVKQGTETLAIGGYTGSGAERPFYGAVDEARVAPFLPSADWIKADYDQVDSTTFLSADTVVEFAELPKPVAAFTLLDSGAAFVQFGGSISSLGGTATSADVYYKVWPVGAPEPAAWTLLASDLEAGNSFEGIVTNLTPQVAYTNLLKAVNDLATPYDSDIATIPFTTSGAGDAGTGGSAKRVGDSIVHTFTVDPDEGDTWTFIPPTYANSVEALVVAGGGPGGYYAGGGGGAGGLVYNAALPVTGGAIYTVKVGAGGIATSAATAYGTNGGDSLIATDSGATTNAIAYGGGAGGNGSLDGQTATRSGIPGGSGGGSSSDPVNNTYVGGSSTAGQGNTGGTGLFHQNRSYGGGGGGAGGTGGSVSGGNTVSAGGGGAGFPYSITGTETYYAGGGGGGGDGNSNNGAYGGPGDGGRGGGGKGGMFTVNGAETEIPTAGTDGLGGGGGGGSTSEGQRAGKNGGSGIVIIRYPIQGDGTTMPNPAIALTSAVHDKANNVVSFTYRVAWAGYGYQVADVGIAWGYSPSALTTTNSIASDKIGSGSGTVQLPNVSKTVYLRAVATNKGGYADDSVETAVFTLFNPDAPVGTISVTDTGVTNAVFSVDVTDFGTGAASASVTVEVCTSADFTGTVLSFPAAADLSSLGSVSIPATGLANNTAYYARAIVVNNKNVELTTDAIEFSTLQPGAPVGTAAETDIGLTTLSASIRVTNFGTGSDSATVRLEVSTASDFSTLAAVSDETAAVLNRTMPLAVSGLSPDTAYYRRVRIRNWWGVDTYVALPVTSTRSVPFSAAGPSWTASGDTVDLSLVVSAVYDGAECTAVLTYGGEEVGTQTFDEAGTVTWSGLAAKADGTVAQIVVTTTVDGADYSKTFSAPVTPGASATTVANVSAHASAANALWMRPGDVAMLPDLYGDASYEVLNERFARIDGSALTALEPGIVGVRCVDASHNTIIMGVVILPDAIGEGSVYVFDETNHGTDNNAKSWSTPTCWRKVGSDTNDSFPQNADDIAMLPFYNKTYGYVRHIDDITIGGLYVGMIRPDSAINCVLERFKEVPTKTVTFRRTDGEPVRVQVCPNGFNDNYQTQLQLGSWPINVVWSSDAVIDCGSSETDHTSGPVGTFTVPNTTPYCTNTLQDVTLMVRGLPGRYVNGAGCTRELHGIWKGTGTIVKEGQGGIVFHGDVGGFSGSFVVKGERNLGGMTVPATQLSLRGGGATNVSATVYGVVAISSNGSPTSNGGAGVFGTSTQVNAAPPITDAAVTFNGESGPRGPDAPAKGLSLFGGTWYAGRIDNKTWDKGAKDDKVLDFLSLGPGMSFVSLQPSQGNNGGYPINAVTVESLRQTARGTLAVYDKSRYAAVPQNETNSLFCVANWADFATGAEGYSVTGAVYQTIPWMISAMNDDWSNTAFASFDAEGRLVYPTRDNVQITLAAENANLYMTSKNLNYGSAGGDYTINSLYISNGGNNRWLGEGRTLRIKSGGLILQGKSAIGLPGRTDNGALVLGDATHPAYVWAKGFNADTNYLGAAVTAAGGFVSAYPGNLCLVGDQTGIADEIAVNGGTLAIGTADADCSLSDGLPIRVCRGAKLFLPKSNAVANSPIKIDGSAEAFGKIELPINQACASLAVRDVFESDEWTTLPSGTYGSSESAAEFVRDDLFVGPGVLTVGEAKTRGVMFLIY